MNSLDYRGTRTFVTAVNSNSKINNESYVSTVTPYGDFCEFLGICYQGLC